MLKDFHFYGLSYHGRTISGVQTCKFKLVWDSWNIFDKWDNCIKQLAVEGEVPESQWLEALKASYPDGCCRHPAGVADNRWYGSGDSWFPYIDKYGKTWFKRSNEGSATSLS